MTIRAFECFRTHAETPVTVFCKTLHEAETIYQKWVCEHHEDHPVELAMIFPYGEERLAARPLLDAAAAQGVAGVGYWDADRGAWSVADPLDPPGGDLAPPEGSVGFYKVESDPGDEAMVFAQSFEQATSLYCEWELDRMGELPDHFTVHKRSRWELAGEHATLRDGLEAGMIGVGRMDNDGVWRVLEPDWEPIYGRD